MAKNKTKQKAAGAPDLKSSVPTGKSGSCFPENPSKSFITDHWLRPGHGHVVIPNQSLWPEYICCYDQRKPEPHVSLWGVVVKPNESRGRDWKKIGVSGGCC